MEKWAGGQKLMVVEAMAEILILANELEVQC